jgi:hypothetical protein
MVQSTENVPASDPVRGWQFVSTNFGDRRDVPANLESLVLLSVSVRY